MTRESTEHLIVEFLERREHEPELSPEEFAREHPACPDDLARHLLAALEVRAMLALTADPRPASIGPYRVLDELGRGGMGVVYEVERDGRRLALKLLPPLSTLDRRALDRFEREARSLQRLDHPNIVDVVDVGTETGTPYLVMEQIEGPGLDGLELPLDPERAASLVRDLARATQSAHEAGVLHRDIKPQNVRLRADGSPVLLDFGLVSAEEEASLTASGDVLGTPRYMAPEQALGRRADRRTDVYALGLLLYELACGRPARPAGTRAESLAQAASGAIPATPRDVPRGLEVIVRTALARRVHRRFASAGELADDLERWLAGRPVHARPPGPVTRAIDRARERPATTAAGVIVVGLLAFAFGSTTGLSAKERGALEGHLDAAFGAWLHGERAIARSELQHVLAMRGNHGAALALERHLRDEATGDTSGHRALARVMNALDRGTADEALAALDELDEPSLSRPLPVVLRARALHLDGRGDEGIAALGRESTDRSRAAATELAWLLGRGSREDEAARAFADARGRWPEYVPLHAEHARFLLENGSIDDGVRAALAAARLVRNGAHDWLVQVLGVAPDPPRVIDALNELVVSTPDDALLTFVLARALDSAHRLPEAAELYGRTIDVDPGQLDAWINLAYLYSGAQLGACGDCERAYAAAPEMYAPARSAALLLDLLRADRGGSVATIRAVGIALDVKKREPELDPLGPLLVEIEEELASQGLTVTARERLRDARTRLRAAVGGD